MEPNKRLALKYCLLLLFSILCGVFQLTNTVFKFWNQKPSLEHYIIDSGSLTPPSITFCGSNPFKNTSVEFDKEGQTFHNWPTEEVKLFWAGKFRQDPVPIVTTNTKL